MKKQWDSLPSTAIFKIAEYLIEDESVLRIRLQLSVNIHWYRTISSPKLAKNLTIELSRNRRSLRRMESYLETSCEQGTWRYLKKLRIKQEIDKSKWNDEEQTSRTRVISILANAPRMNLNSKG